jgi:hypothetical protein
MVMAPNSNQLQIQRNAFYGFSTLAAVPQVWAADHWYKFEITWETNGNITGRLFDSDGTTLLNTVSTNNSDVTSGGIGFRAFDSTKFFDTVVATQGTTSDFYQVTLAAGQPLEVETATPAGGAGEFPNSLDPVIRVYNSAGVLVASDDNSVDGRNARVKYNVPKGAGGVYYVEVASSSATPELTAGEYLLSVKGNTATASGAARSATPAPASGTSLPQSSSAATPSNLSAFQSPTPVAKVLPAGKIVDDNGNAGEPVPSGPLGVAVAPAAVQYLYHGAPVVVPATLAAAGPIAWLPMTAAGAGGSQIGFYGLATIAGSGPLSLSLALAPGSVAATEVLLPSTPSSVRAGDRTPQGAGPIAIERVESTGSGIRGARLGVGTVAATAAHAPPSKPGGKLRHHRHR